MFDCNNIYIVKYDKIVMVRSLIFIIVIMLVIIKLDSTIKKYIKTKNDYKL